MRQVLLPIALVCLALLLISVESILPSAGILGILAAVALLSGVAMSYYYSGLVVGTAFMVISAVVVVGFIVKLVRWWPQSTMGKLILVDPPPEELLVDRAEIRSLVGRVGQTLGLMMPGGYVEIEGKRYDAVAEVAIEQGDWVRVTGVSGGQTLNVRPISREDALESKQADQRNVDPLSTTAEDVLDDPFEDALG